MEKEKKQKTLIQKIHQVGVRVGSIEKTKENPFYKSKYFDINDLLAVLNPALEKQGLSVIQPLDMETGTNLHAVIRTIITDGKETQIYTLPLPTIQDPQKMGSAITYYRRYSLQSLFGLQTNDDDDGNVASKATPQKAKTTDDIDLD